ncbi:MAG TPA: DUF4129 domain-containing protein [Gaiellaceae bacterium]
MQPFPQGHGRSLRVASVLLALLVLLAVVAFASRTGFGHSSNQAPTPGYVNWATSVFLVLFFMMTPVAIYAYLLQAKERLDHRKHRSYPMRVMRGWILLVAVFGIAYLIRQYLPTHFHLSSGLHQLFFSNHGVNGHGKNGAGRSDYTPTFQWPVLWGAIILVLATAGWWYWWRKTHPTPTRATADGPTLEEEVASSIGDAIDDLEAEPDPRRAVIAAYARMESVFARSGMRRDASETATEYLRRILLSLTSQSDAVKRLTGLFEQAKFSAHTIDAGMKRDAIESLRIIRADLVGASA